MSLKDRTNEYLLNIYNEKGFKFALSLAEGLVLANHNKPIQQRNVVVGEICEAVLALCVMEFMKHNPDRTKGWFFKNQFIMCDLETKNSEFLTEVDFVLFTPSKAVLFECKSYIGAKTIVDKGTIVREGKKDFDVYKQHRNHALVFSRMFGGFRINNVKEFDCYQLAVFLFGKGDTVDKRRREFKEVMPFVDVNGVFSLLSKIDNTPRFNMDYVKRAVNIVEKNKSALANKHLNYVKSLHSKK